MRKLISVHYKLAFSTPELFSFEHDGQREELWGTGPECLLWLVYDWNNKNVSDWSIYSALNLQCVQGTVKEMDETPKKLYNRKVKICRCCNSHLSNVYDSIDLFGKTAKRENVVEKLKEVGKIEVQESDRDFLTTKICRKCFRKIKGLAKAIDDFRNICTQSKEIQISDLDNARLKRGRKP